VPDDVPGFVVAEDAALFIGHEGVVMIDARPGTAYRGGHVPGAIRLDWTELRDPDGGLLTGKLDEDRDHLAAELASRGVGRDAWAIVMGDPLEHWGEDGRIAWTLLLLGAEQVSVVDGGWAAWTKAGLPTQTGRVELPPAEFVAAPREEFLARKRRVAEYSERAAQQWDFVLVDVRAAGEFRGAPDAPNYGAMRRGHVPRAVNLPWQVLVDGDGLLRSRDQLERTLIPLGIRPDAHIVTYCTGGVRSAHTWWVLHSIGYPDVRNYAGSWWEWSVDRKLPIERGGMRPGLRPPAPPWPPEIEELEPSEAEVLEEPEPEPEPEPGPEPESEPESEEP